MSVRFYSIKHIRKIKVVTFWNRNDFIFLFVCLAKKILCAYVYRFEIFIQQHALGSIFSIIFFCVVCGVLCSLFFFLSFTFLFTRRTVCMSVWFVSFFYSLSFSLNIFGFVVVVLLNYEVGFFFLFFFDMWIIKQKQDENEKFCLFWLN